MRLKQNILDLIQYYQDKKTVNQQALDYLSNKINWRKPQTYNDFINLIKIDPKSKSMWKYTDKYTVRRFVEKTIGSKYLKRLYGVYKAVEDIKLKELPSQFALKATHGSGYNLICKNKLKLNWSKAKQQLNEWLKVSYYSFYKENSYQLIKPRIICEEYLTHQENQVIDYKFFCWHGKPYFIQVDINRFKKNRYLDFYNLDWKKLPMSLRYPRSNKLISKPKNFNRMINLASMLSFDFDHVRVDLFNINGQIYFGEMTFTPNCGFFDFKPDKYNYLIGQCF